MMLKFILILIVLNSVSSQLSPLESSIKVTNLTVEITSQQNEINQTDHQVVPSLQIILIVHPYNKFNELPFVLSAIQLQNYPKDRINILIQSDVFNSVISGHYDRTVERFKFNDLTVRMLKSWKSSVESEYHRFELKLTQLEDDNEEHLTDYWSADRYAKLMNLKLYGFNYAMNEWSDFCLFQDADVILTNKEVYRSILNKLAKNDATILAPMLFSLNVYSNFWAGMDQNGYYKRTDEYVPILERQAVGQFKVPMVYSFVFIDLRDKRARNLKFIHTDLEQQIGKAKSNKIPFDDIIVFAKSAEHLNLSFYVDNEEIYGFLMPPIDKTNLKVQKQHLIDLELDNLIENNRRFEVVNALEQYHYSERYLDLRVDKIYVINLERRKERKAYMQSACDVLGLNCDFVKAVDGKLIDKQFLIENKINVMKDYLDPFHKRPMTYGEIGCFMSHYNIWLDIVSNNRRWSIVFEDDVRFEKEFISNLERLMDFILDLDDDQMVDFVYLGRKREGKAEEEKWFANKTKKLVYPTYSYWTIGYLISLNGAKKLIESEPLKKLIPVDEYLPIMFDKHPNKEWTSQFTKRNLIALSVHPLLIQPMHYVGDQEYISDTEDSIKLNYVHDHIEL